MLTQAKGRNDPQSAAESAILRFARGKRSHDFSLFIRRSGNRWDVETFAAETIYLGSGSTLAKAWHSQADVRENSACAARPKDLGRDR
jgi:hypothetical protein